jgi:hypothetical protein
MVTSWDESDRRELAELCREHDRMMAEHAASQRASYVRRNNADEVFKVIENATPSAPEPEPDVFSTEQVDALAHIINELHREFDQLIARHIDSKTAELRGKIDALLTLFGQRNIPDQNNSKSADVFHLPTAGILKRRNDGNAA